MLCHACGFQHQAGHLIIAFMQLLWLRLSVLPWWDAGPLACNVGSLFVGIKCAGAIMVIAPGRRAKKTGHPEEFCLVFMYACKHACMYACVYVYVCTYKKLRQLASWVQVPINPSHKLYGR